MTTEEIWRDLRGDLLGHLKRSVRDEHLAEDLLQETFVRVHDALERRGEPERIAPWVFTIAQNVVRDQRRRVLPEPGLEAGDVPTPAGEENRNDEVGAWLPGLVAELPEEHREAVRLAELEGAPLRVVAERLGISLTAAKSRVQRGRARMAAMLQACCRFELDGRGNVVDYARRRARCVCDDEPPAC